MEKEKTMFNYQTKTEKNIKYSNKKKNAKGYAKYYEKLREYYN
jgi:hypothetical protein